MMTKSSLKLVKILQARFSFSKFVTKSFLRDFFQIQIAKFVKFTIKHQLNFPNYFVEGMLNFKGKNSSVASCQCKCNPLPSGPSFIMHNSLPKYNIGHDQFNLVIQNHGTFLVF
jgi:hypothetical protein